MENLTIVGTGPAGLTAAIYSARAGLAPLVLDGSLPGGQLTQTTEVENYPGVPAGILGFDLMEAFRRQAVRFGARLQADVVERVELKSGGPQQLYLSGGSQVQTKALIVATGAQPRWLGLPSEQALKNKGVSACATCDGAFFRGVPIVVVGGGDSAVEEALFLTRFASRVLLVHRRDELRASRIMQDRVLHHAKVELRLDSVVDEIQDVLQDKVTGVVLRNVHTGVRTALDCGAVFVAIGHVPNTVLFRGQLDMDEAGYLTVAGPGSRTRLGGVFLAGDCADRVYRQAITAAGMGCQAAIDAERWLEAQS
jgi:thioredoxin reductase (NADPH)